MSPADRARIAELLQDESLSFREIARRCGYSDHTVRRIWREITHDPRPIRNNRGFQPSENTESHPSAAGAVAVASLIGLLIIAAWAFMRQMPPGSWE